MPLELKYNSRPRTNLFKTMKYFIKLFIHPLNLVNFFPQSTKICLTKENSPKTHISHKFSTTKLLHGHNFPANYIERNVSNACKNLDTVISRWKNSIRYPRIISFRRLNPFKLSTLHLWKQKTYIYLSLGIPNFIEAYNTYSLSYQIKSIHYCVGKPQRWLLSQCLQQN